MEIEGWESLKISDFCKVIRGASPRPKGDKRFYGGPCPRLMVEDVTRDGKYVTPKVDSLTELGASMSRPMKAGDMTVVCSGTVGIPAFLAIDACIHDGFIGLISFRKNVYNEYIYYQLEALKERIDDAATHGGVFTILTVDGFSDFEIDVPKSVSEQKAIAESLSDADALITSLEKLIEKKSLIKSELLETNFKEASQQTTEYSLFEIADNSKDAFIDGDWVEAEHLTSKGIRLLQTGNIENGWFKDNVNKKYINEQSFRTLKCKQVFTGDLLISRLAEPAGRCCLLPEIAEEK